MATIETITMSLQELDRLKSIQAVAAGELKPWKVAERLHLSVRQVHRLVNRYRAQDAAGLVSQRRGRPSNHRLASGVASVALTLIREHYADFGPTLACEKLRERHGLRLAKETVRRLMTTAGLWVPRKQRPPKVYQPRHRRACLGELIQIDGCDHSWFEERAPACTALVYVDDATSRLQQLYFTYAESTFSYFEATRGYLVKHGKPVSFYSDKASVFRANNPHATGGQGHTQFGRMLYELNIEGICANSSQAKGRVERAHLTLQDRLVKELRLRGISTIEDANRFAPHFMAEYNSRFSKAPRSEFNAHRAVRPDEDLDILFTVREARKVSHSLTLQYDKILYLLDDTPDTRTLIGRYLDVYEYPDGRIELRASGGALPYTTYDKLSEITQGAIVDNKRLGHILQVAQLVQEKRDNRRGLSTPSRIHREQVPAQRKPVTDKKRQRQLTPADLAQAIDSTAPATSAGGNRSRS